jgi:multiple sugar transport system permease protein
VATQAKAAPLRAGTAPQARLVGDRTAGMRRRIAYVFLVAYALLMFVPFAWTIITSFKTIPDSVQLTVIPNPFTVEGWRQGFTELKPPLPVLFFNSALVAGIVTLTNLVFGSMAGYAFGRLRFPGREALFLLVLATLMIPDQLRLVPVFQLLNSLGLTRGDLQYVGIVVILAVSASSIFLLRQYFLSIPKDLEEAARIDGAGYFMTFWRVMLPLASPALAAVAILSFQSTWNSLFWPLIILQDVNHFTLPLGLAQFRFTYFTNWPALMAVVVIATIPILVLYVFFQRYFVEGIAASGVKG